MKLCLYTPDAREKLRHPGIFRKGQGIRLYNYRNSIGIEMGVKIK